MSVLQGVVRFGGKIRTRGGVEVQTHPDQGFKLGDKVWVLMDETTELIVEVKKRQNESSLDDGLNECCEEKEFEPEPMDEDGFVINPAECET